MERAGAGQFFIDLPMALAGRSAGGPAKVAVMASALFGSVSGSAIANTVSTGAFTIPFNLSWHAAATVRAGLSKAGLPLGLQSVGPRHRDDLVMQAAWAFEQARPWAHHWPSV